MKCTSVCAVQILEYGERAADLEVRRSAVGRAEHGECNGDSAGQNIRSLLLSVHAVFVSA